MAFNLQSYSRFAVRLFGEPVSAGSIEKPVSLSVTGNVHKKTATIANGANTAMYSAELTNFSFLYVASDYDVRLAMTDTDSSSFSVTISGTDVDNEYGIPFVLSSDETVDANTTVNSVVAHNSSGSTATVTLIAIE